MMTTDHKMPLEYEAGTLKIGAIAIDALSFGGVPPVGFSPAAFPKAATPRASRLPLGALVIDPARCKELINAEFVADGAFLLFENDRCHLGGQYGALPAAIADDPAVVGCFFGKGEFAATALVTLRWDAGSLSFHKLSPSVAVRTTTVAGRGGVANLSPEGRPA